MDSTRVRCILVVSGGRSRRVGTSGVVIGRQPDCDLVGDDPSLSRRHALVRLTMTGAEIMPLGKQAIEVNGKLYDKPHELHDGDHVKLPGLELDVQVAAQRPDPRGGSIYRLRCGQESFGITHTPFVIGGDRADDLIIAKWPAHAMALHVAQRELFVELATGQAKRNGIAIVRGVLEPFVPLDELSYRGQTFVVEETAHQVAATTATSGVPAMELPTRVSIEILPRGGRVAFTLADGERTLFLHDRQLDFMTALLRPPAGYRAGDYVPDDVVLPVVWPRSAKASRTDINVLILRCRKSLVDAGLAGPRLIERAPTGGATRIALSPHATVELLG